MPNTNKRVVKATLATGALQTLHTAGVKTLIMAIALANTAAVARVVTLEIAGTVYLPAVSLPPGALVELKPHQVIENTETIKGGQTVGTDVNVFVSVVEITP